MTGKAIDDQTLRKSVSIDTDVDITGFSTQVRAGVMGVRILVYNQRRAEAVKAVLVSQLNVDAGRLTTAGLGATKPIESNDTPTGRAQNRRVEFVRQ